VHQGTLRAIYPIFVDSNSRFPRYEQTVGIAGSLAAEIVLQEARYSDQLIDLSAEASAAVSGAYEERYLSSYCQYLIETRDSELIDRLKSDTAGLEDDDDYLRENLNIQLEVEFYSLQEQVELLLADLRIDLDSQEIDQSATLDLIADLEGIVSSNGPEQTNPAGGVSVASELESISDRIEEIESTSTANDRAFLAKLEDLNELLLDYQAMLQRNYAVGEVQDIVRPQIVSFVNPCRRFDLGTEVLISRFGLNDEYVLQPLLALQLPE
jgi:hypothetical protein